MLHVRDVIFDDKLQGDRRVITHTANSLQLVSRNPGD
jgi:hypothetical protein